MVSSSFRTAGGHRRYKLSMILEISGEVTIENNAIHDVVLGYAGVSGHKQKKDLQNQIQCIKNFARKNSYSLHHIYSDIASGLNDKRQNFLRLLRTIPIIRPKAVIITYKDRLARFGINVITLFCKIFSCKLITIYEKQVQDLQMELAEGVISVITSYAGRFHRRRRGMLSNPQIMR